MAAETSNVTTTELEKATSTRELKTTDISVSMRHIAGHVDALRNNKESDSKHSNPEGYVNELYRVIVAVTSLLEDLAYIMRKKGMNVPEVVTEGLTSTLKGAKVRVFHAFTNDDFEIANKIRYGLNNGHKYKLEDEFSKEALELQYNVLRQCLMDAFAAQLLFAEAASKKEA